ncbi:hypothetical protein [Bacteroides sp.]|uniref:hypothetical protein n=1 Tax=Bacteroides sp. TaxID=29523 RepID=UPI003AB5925F
MKYINKISVLLSLLTVLLFSACSTDQEGPLYAGGAGQGVTFISKSLNSVVVSPAEPTFTIDLLRSNTASAYSGDVTISALIDKVPFEGCTVTGFNFAAGENKTTVTVDVTPLQIGKVMTITLALSIPEEDIAISGTSQASFTTSKDYNWQELGEGTFTDTFFFEGTNKVTVFKAEGFDRYRVVKPYDEYYANGLPTDLVGDFTLSTARVANLDFWINDGAVLYNKFAIGLNYVGGGDIFALHPSNFAGMPTTFNKVVDEKTIQLAPYYYIEELSGGFNGATEDGVITITLP